MHVFRIDLNIYGVIFCRLKTLEEPKLTDSGMKWSKEEKEMTTRVTMHAFAAGILMYRFWY
jgi:hypothetical protein